MTKRSETILLVFVLLFAVVLRLWRLGEIPSTINGDETGSLLHSWQLLHGQISIFDLTHDLSVPALIFLPKMLLMALLGTQNALFAVRLTTTLYSILALYVFYRIVRKDVATFPALLATLLFASSYWFLNFSRISWISMDNIFWGLSFYYFLDKVFTNKRLIDAAIAGGIAALVLMNYMGGWIFLIAGAIITIPKLMKPNKQTIVMYGLMVIIFILFFSPMLYAISIHPTRYISRAKSRLIFNLKNEYYDHQPNEIMAIMGHQLEYVLRGFLLFDPQVSNEWTENKRLMPSAQPAVNRVVVAFFYVGLIYAVSKRKGWFFLLVYILNILILQLFSVYVPSWSRAIITLPAVYYFAAMGIGCLTDLSSKLKGHLVGVIPILLICTCLGFAIHDVSIYWNWIQSEAFEQAQKPAIFVTESREWSEAQLTWIQAGNKPFGIDAWHAGWVLVISEAKQAVVLEWDSQQFHPEGLWLIIRGQIKNLTDEDIRFTWRDFTLHPPSSDDKIHPHLEASAVAGYNEGIDISIAPVDGFNLKAQQATPFILVFDAPQEIQNGIISTRYGVEFKLRWVAPPASIPGEATTDQP